MLVKNPKIKTNYKLWIRLNWIIIENMEWYNFKRNKNVKLKYLQWYKLCVESRKKNIIWSCWWSKENSKWLPKLILLKYS